MKKYGKASCLKRVIITALILAVTLSGCAFMKRFKASDALVGSIKLFKDTDGFEKLDDKYIAEFVETVNKKYGKDSIKDEHLKGTMKFSVSIVSEDAENGHMEIPMTGDGNIDTEYSEGDQILHMNMGLDMKSMGMSILMERDQYIDYGTKEEYSKGVVMGEESPWTKSKYESANQNGAPYTTFTQENVEAIYQDANSKGYAVVLKGNAFGDLGGIELSKDTTVDSEKIKTIATFDEGIALAGIYIDFTEAYKNDDYIFNSFVIELIPEAYNEGKTLAIPEDAKNAIEKNDNEDVFDFIESETEESQEATAPEEAAASDNNKTDANAESAENSSEAKADIPEEGKYTKGEDIPVVVNGEQIRLGEMTLQEFLDITGYEIEKEDEGKVVNKGSTEYLSINTNSRSQYISVSVENYNGNEVRNAKDCTLDGISYTAFSNKGRDSIVSIGDITVGSSIEDVYAAFGAPSDTYEDNDYSSLSYDFGDYYIDVNVYEADGVDSISISYY